MAEKNKANIDSDGVSSSKYAVQCHSLRYKL